MKLENNQSGKVTYTGNKDLVFGVELYELHYSKDTQKLSMSPTSDAKVLKGEQPALIPALIGDPEGDAFISIA